MKNFETVISDQINYLKSTGVKEDEIIIEDLAFEILDFLAKFSMYKMSFDVKNIRFAHLVDRTENFQFFFVNDYIVVVNKFYKLS